MTRIILVIMITIASKAAICQLEQRFDTDDLSAWEGAIQDYGVNADNALQLMAAEAGSSLIYTALAFPDVVLWSMTISLDFSPSTSNKLEVWLAVDDPLLSDPSGYKLEIGSTGSDDAIEFYKVNQGEEIFIAAGEMGQVASAFDMTISLSKDADDFWTLNTQLAGEDTPSLSLEVLQEDDFLNLEANYFGINCKYTSTRTEGFTFDDIIVERLLPDTVGPMLVEYTVIDPQKISLTLNEAIDVASLNPSNVSISGITVSEIIALSRNTICVALENPLASGVANELTITGIKDESGNEIEPTVIVVRLLEDPSAGDLLINELLYEPASGNSADYVEIVNVSDKYLSLDNVWLGRARSSAKDVNIVGNIALEPNAIIAFTDDVAEVISQYEPPSEASIITLNITNYVQDEGNVWLKTIVDGIETTIDSLDYTDDFHAALSTNNSRKGASIERISVLSDTNDPDNWISASATSNFGTPGYENSQRTSPNPNVEISLENKVFSPNGDGYKDVVRLNYNLDVSGYIANVYIYDDAGRSEIRIAENKLLGTTGSIIWEGNLEDGRIAPTGMYIITYDLFNSNGETINGKYVCVLAQSLN